MSQLGNNQATQILLPSIPHDGGRVRITDEALQSTQQEINDLIGLNRQKLPAILADVLEKLAAAGPDSWVIFSDNRNPDNYVQLTREPAMCEVSSRAWEGCALDPLDDEAQALLRERDFIIREILCNPERLVDYSDVQAIAELVDWLYVRVLGSGSTLELRIEMELVVG
jgi:hypothetical protein